MILETQSVQHVFYWSADGAPELGRAAAVWESAELGFGSSQQALLFLRRFAALHEFRGLLNGQFPGQTFRWRNDEVIAKVADLLVKKRLTVQKRWKRATSSIATYAEGTKVPRREVVEKSEPTEPPTFLPNHDGPTQAEALASAASGGDAFCEECEKARQQMAASKAPIEPQEPSFQPNHDGDAQAKSLTDASKDGAPFCEECEKARQQKAA